MDSARIIALWHGSRIEAYWHEYVQAAQQAQHFFEPDYVG